MWTCLCCNFFIVTKAVSSSRVLIRGKESITNNYDNDVAIPIIFVSTILLTTCVNIVPFSSWQNNIYLLFKMFSLDWPVIELLLTRLGSSSSCLRNFSMRLMDTNAYTHTNMIAVGTEEKHYVTIDYVHESCLIKQKMIFPLYLMPKLLKKIF